MAPKRLQINRLAKLTGHHNPRVDSGLASGTRSACSSARSSHSRHASLMRPSGLRSVRMHLLCSLMSARRPDPSFPASLRAACDPWAPGDALQPYCRICEARGSPLPHAAAPADRTNPRCAALVAKRTVPARSANQDVVRPKLCAAVPSEVPTSSESPFGDRGDTP